MTDDPQGTLPELTDDDVDRIEDAVFAEIARDRRRARSRRSRRTTWIGGAAAAVAVVAAAAVIGPSLSPGPTGADTIALAPAVGGSEWGLADQSGGMAESADLGVAESASRLPGDSALTTGAGVAREIIANASATVRTDDVSVAVAAIAADAAARGGWVEQQTMTDAASGAAPDQYGVWLPTPPAGGAWITVRVPSDELTAAMDALADVGDVSASQISRQDVTDQAVDLRAREESAEASVQRLTELMAQTGSVSELIEAESALAQRQAELESLRQQLEYLESQVAMSSLSVTVEPPTAPVDADPDGFVDGIAAGWNGLIATLNGIVLGLGFLLPWLGVVAVATVIVGLVVRAVRRRRERRTRTAE